MIFKGYEKYLEEEYINFNDYINDNEPIDNFHENFFNAESAKKKGVFSGIFNGVRSVLSSKSDTPYENGRIGYLKHHHINHVLLIVSQGFINKMINIARKNEARTRPNDYIQNFIHKFTQSFESNDIQCSFVIYGALNDRNDKNIKHLGKWLNLEKILDQITLDDEQGYLLGFKDIRVTTDNTNDAVSVKIGESEIILGSNCSMLMGHNDLFLYTIPSPDSIIKITNLKDDRSHEINFITENIKTARSLHIPLQDEYLAHGYFDDFIVDAQELAQKDITIIFNNTPNEIPITLSKTMGSAHSDPDQKQCTTIINLRNQHKVNLKYIITPFVDNLKEVHYYVINLGGKLILVGGRNIKKCQDLILARIVANIEDRTFELTNLSSASMTFQVANHIATHKVVRKSENQHILNANTDYPSDPVDSSSTNLYNKDIKPGHSYLFSNKIIFDNTAISFIEEGIKVTYTNFTIASFNQSFELGRHTLRHFQNGNIIDADENITDGGGRVYVDGSSKLLGTELSREPLTLTLKDDTFTLANSINSNFSVTLNLDGIPEKKLAFGENISLTKDELFESGNIGNTLSIVKNDITLLAVEITA